MVRVHPELLKAQRIPSAKVDEDFWADRYQDINAWSGTWPETARWF